MMTAAKPSQSEQLESLKAKLVLFRTWSDDVAKMRKADPSITDATVVKALMPHYYRTLDARTERERQYADACIEIACRLAVQCGLAQSGSVPYPTQD